MGSNQYSSKNIDKTTGCVSELTLQKYLIKKYYEDVAAYIAGN